MDNQETIMSLELPENEQHKGYDRSVVVCHPAQQHSYHLARAVEKKGALLAYVTTIYFKNTKLLYRILAFLLDKENIRRMRGRQNPFIESKLRQFNEIFGLFFLFSGRVLRNKAFVRAIGDSLGAAFGRKVAKYVNRANVDILICFDTYALAAFEGINNSGTLKVLDMSSIPLERICYLINEQTPNGLHARNSLSMTRSIYSDAMVETSRKEIRLADYFLVASNFTKHQLVETGVESKKIYVVPYGVDLDRYCPEEGVTQNYSKKLTFIFVGRMTAVKGFHLLIEALSRLPSGSFECLLVGHPQNSEFLLKELSDDFKFLGPLVNSDMPDIYRLADVLVAPSLYDGFGLAVLEAMASGLGVICSRNAGASDIVRHGETGLLIDPNSVDDLHASLEYLLDNPTKLSVMKTKARLQAENYCWSIYDESIANVIDKLKPPK
jgi:glycosyltransferase involved in cell wall biosynthesis